MIKNINNVKLDTLLKIFDKELNNKNIYHISRASKLTYTAVINLFKLFEKEGIVLTEKVGREKNIKFTHKGLIICDLINQLKNILQNNGGEIKCFSEEKS